MTVSILGTEYSVEFLSEAEEKKLKTCSGFCDWTTKRIVVEKEKETEVDDLERMEEYTKKVLRHEIIHAFLCESGLDECSGETYCWARNETMVDWFARQGAKIYQAWKEVGAL